MSKITLSEYLEKIAASGKHYFLVSKLEEELGMNKNSISASLSRMNKKNRLKMIKRGFGVILGGNGFEPHPSYYIDAMMKHLEARYYVGLLAAAAHWGASHQASMSYQVVVDKPVHKIEFRRGRIEFIVKKNTFLL